MIALPPIAALPLALAQALPTGGNLAPLVVEPAGWQRWVAVLASVAIIVIAIALIAIALALIAAALQSRKIYGSVRGLLDRLHTDLKPILGHATDAAENVDFVSTAIRADVEEFRATLKGVQKRLNRAAGKTEERIHRFNALLEIVQQEAEDLFIETASTVRGIQVGARTLREGEARPAFAEDAGKEMAEPISRRRPHP